MKTVENATSENRLNERLATGGFRFTPQRERVYSVVLQERDHPTAEQVFMRAKKAMPDISMATVYNCLDALVHCGLVKQVNMDRGASRFCPNMHEHCHFYCDQCAGVYDIDLTRQKPEMPMPRGFKATHYELSIRGLCPDCAAKKK
jgi:Fur family peroxide stress response transcriptional regulator